MTGQAAQIVGMSALTAVGLTPARIAAAIRAGVSRVGDHPFMVDADGEALGCAWVPSVPAEVLGAERLVALAHQGLTPLEKTLADYRVPKVSVHLALPEARPGFAEDQSRLVMKQLASASPRFSFQECGRGHAGAMLGLKRAFDSISNGSEALCVVGGVDSYFDADTLDWLDSDLRLSRASRRGGFPPGEGAAFLVLADARVQAQLRLPSVASLSGVFCATELRDETSPEGLLGEALSTAYLAAGDTLGGASFDDLYIDINDERARTTDLGFALLRAGRLFRDGTSYTTPISNVGDLGAATAPLNCILAAQAWSRGYAHGPKALVSAASWGGLRAAAILEQGKG